jgi:phosphatidylglycerol---prolipoprotein diacylglyceryl transferase
VRPVLFTLPLVGEFPAYLVLLTVGFALAVWCARREEDRSGRNGDRVVDLGILMVICGILGARLLAVLADGHLEDFIHLCTDPTQVAPAEANVRAIVCASDAECAPYYLCDEVRRACHPPRDCLEVLKFWHGGLAYYGGFLLAVPVGLWYARRRGLGVWRIADLTSPFIALGLFFGRMGCFLNGCCYGAECDLPWAMKFPGLLGRVHPTQLYEAAAALLIATLLYGVVRPRKRAHGQVFAALLVLYGATRFLLEYVRADDRGIYFGLSTSQWISLPLVAWGLFLWVLWVRWSRPRAV